jgi:hypothetical protein
MKACLFALLLLGGIAAPAAWAEEGSASGATHQGTGVQAAPAGHGAEGGGKVETGGADVNAHHGAAKSDAAANPIDTRIAEPPRAPPNSNKLRDWTKIGRTAAPLVPKPFVLRHPAAPNTGVTGAAKNAIGATVHDQVGLEPTRGSFYPGPGTGLRPGGLESANLHGATIGGVPGNSGAGKAGNGSPYPGAVLRSPSTIGTNRSVINGTGMIRPGSGPPVLGGPAKSVVGINGTNVRSKH